MSGEHAILDMSRGTERRPCMRDDIRVQLKVLGERLVPVSPAEGTGAAPYLTVGVLGEGSIGQTGNGTEVTSGRLRDCAVEGAGRAGSVLGECAFQGARM